MTNQMRADVVEALRCAADGHPEGGLNGMWRIDYVAPGVRIECWAALFALIEGGDYQSPLVEGSCIDEGYRHALLEAAQRVAERSWP